MATFLHVKWQERASNWCKFSSCYSMADAKWFIDIWCKMLDIIICGIHVCIKLLCLNICMYYHLIYQGCLFSFWCA